MFERGQTIPQPESCVEEMVSEKNGSQSIYVDQFDTNMTKMVDYYSMTHTISQKNLDSISSCWASDEHQLQWNSLFVLPPWLKAWWQEIGSEAELYLNTIKQRERALGIAPLLIAGGSASILGSADVCDYLDFITAPGMEKDFFNNLLDDLREKGVNIMDLGPLRPDSTVLTHLAGIARDRGYEVLCHQEDVSHEIDLPSTWDEYLALLNAKQRHEVRRKLRRLSEAGEVDYYCVTDSSAVHDTMDTFLDLFSKSREDKTDFLTARMESFFRTLADTMAEAGLLKFGVLELNASPVAVIMCFDYNDYIYLYNSGYDPSYNSLSVGLLSKVLCIKESIQEGKKKFDFLKGDEVYKQRLGGKEVPLYRCQITIK